MNIQTAGLLRIAAEDEAPLLLAGLPDSSFGYHAQAAIEKRLKALINEHGKPFRRIHDSDALKSDVENLGEPLPILPVQLGDLNGYATGYRHGDTSPPQPLDGDQWIKSVQLLRAQITARIQALGQTPPLP